LKSLLARLILIVSVAMVPAIALQAYTENEARRTRQQLVEDEALRLVRLVASEQQRIAEGAEQVLNVLGGAPSVQDSRSEDCQRLLANLLRQSPRYNYASVIGLDGHLICAPGPFDPSIDVSDRSFFRLALQTGGFVIGEYAVGRFSKQPTIHMAKPFRNRDGAIAGVVEIALSLDWLGQQLERLALPPEAVASVKDRNGTVLARYPDGARFVGHPMVAENRFSLEGTEVKVVELTGLDGKQRITAYSPLGGDPKGLRIGVGLDREVTFAPVTQANRKGLILIIAGAVLALATTALAGTRLTRRPLDQLLKVADRWRHGDLAARTGLHADSSEFGRLAAAFDSMAVAQENRECTLRLLSSELAARVQREVAAREEMRFLAHHDAVTSLPNRTQLRVRLEQVIERKSFDGRMTAVIILDLDGFKGINDTMGHQAGDELLKEVADRLLHLVRRDDIVARLGGDEFVILQSDLTQAHAAEALAQRLIARLAEPAMIAGQQVRIGASAGVALYPLDGSDSDTLLKHADMALYCAKNGGRGTFRRFDHWMIRSLQERRALENDLRRAFATMSSSCTSSRSFPARTSPSPGSRRCCAGITRSTASSRRRALSLSLRHVA
jgi:diguanylate cyclase (GGDEF)-like protein